MSTKNNQTPAANVTAAAKEFKDIFKQSPYCKNPNKGEENSLEKDLLALLLSSIKPK